MSEPSIQSLIQKANHRHRDWKLAAQYSPIIRFDIREPFLPIVAGYTVFDSAEESASFPRQVELKGNQYEAHLAIEYAIWWDWDIEHLYELEHVWVYINDQGQLVHAEASWHGGFHDMMRTSDTLPMRDNHLIVLSEPGKHAFAPEVSWFERRRRETRHVCRHPGKGGVWVTPLFEGVILSKSHEMDMLVQRYLSKFAFEPTYNFSQEFSIASDRLVPWAALNEWIPRRVNWQLKRLDKKQV